MCSVLRIVLTQLFCISTASLGNSELIYGVTNKLSILEYQCGSEIDFATIDTYLRHFKANIKSVHDCKLLHYALIEEPFEQRMTEYLYTLDNLTKNISSALSAIHYIARNIEAYSNDNLETYFDMANIERNYLIYLDILLDQIRYHTSITACEIEPYKSAMLQIDLLKNIVLLDATTIDKVLLMDRVVNMTYHFCIQSLFTQIFYSVNYFYTLYVKFTYENSQYKSYVINFFTSIDSSFDDTIILSNCSEFSKVRSNLLYIHYLYTSDNLNVD